LICISLKLVSSLFLSLSFLHNPPDANRIQEGQKQKLYLLKLHNEVLANICTGQNKILANVRSGHFRQTSVINYIFLM
jgi:hypothetical protein